MTDAQVHLEIGFAGGGLTTAIVTTAAAQELEDRLKSDLSSTLQLDAEDGRYTIVLASVCYVKHFTRESRVGFGGA
jgi:hypothetical protein